MTLDAKTAFLNSLGLANFTGRPADFALFAHAHGLSARIVDERFTPQGLAVRFQVVNGEGADARAQDLPGDFHFSHEGRAALTLGDILSAIQKAAILGAIPPDDVRAICAAHGLDAGAVGAALRENGDLHRALEWILPERVLREFLNERGDAGRWQARIAASAKAGSRA